MVYHFIKTATKAKNDARLRKWIKTFNDDWKIKACVIAFVTNEQSWHEEFVEIRTKKIWFRKFFKIGRGRAFKIVETFLKLLPVILKSNPGTTFIYHDNQLYSVILFHAIFKKFLKHRLVWDMHELPHSFLLKWPVFRHLLKYMLKNFDYCIVANNYRGQYINERLNTEKEFKSLNNYPTKVDLEREKNLQFDLGFDKKDTIALWIGNPSIKRNFIPFYEACKKLDFKILVLGRISKESNFLNYDKNCKVLFVNPETIPDYIDNTSFSAIFYRNVNKNNWLCEPNRLYLLMSRGAKFIAGNNPQIKKALKHYEYAKVLNSVAPDYDSILEGVKKLNEIKKPQNPVEYGRKFLKENTMIWEYQIDHLKKIFKV